MRIIILQLLHITSAHLSISPAHCVSPDPAFKHGAQVLVDGAGVRLQPAGVVLNHADRDAIWCEAINPIVQPSANEIAVGVISRQINQKIGRVVGLKKSRNTTLEYNICLIRVRIFLFNKTTVLICSAAKQSVLSTQSAAR